MSKVIFAVAGDGKTILYQTTVADDYSLQAIEHTDGQGMLALNPCSYFDGTQRQVMPGKWAALQALQATDAESVEDRRGHDRHRDRQRQLRAFRPAGGTQARYNVKKAARAAYLASEG